MTNPMAVHVVLSSCLMFLTISIVESFSVPPLQRYQAALDLRNRGPWNQIANLPKIPQRGGIAASTVCSGTVSRKDKNRQKKQQKLQENAVKRELQQKRDSLVDGLLDEIGQEKRDVAAISAAIAQLRELRPISGQREGVLGDWRLAYVETADALHNFGTGLGRLPGTTIIDAWVSLNEEGKVKVQEVCRVVGPFPNIQNTLDGTWEYRERAAAAGFAPAAADPAAAPAAASQAPPRRLRLAYAQLTDGRGRVTTAETGFRAREVVLDVGYWGDGLLILDSEEDGPLVWQREDNLDKEVGRLLRADLTGAAAKPPPSLIEGIAQLATGAKKPWEFFKP